MANSRQYVGTLPDSGQFVLVDVWPDGVTVSFRPNDDPSSSWGAPVHLDEVK